MQGVTKWIKDRVVGNIRWIMITVLCIEIIGLIVSKASWWWQVFRDISDLFQ